MAVSPPPPPRNPAGKRIGLKRTQTHGHVADPPTLERPAVSPASAPIRPSSSTDNPRPQKRAKLSADVSRTDIEASDIIDPPSSSNQPTERNAEVASTADLPARPTPQRMKSVTFTPETKEQDADNKPTYRQRAKSGQKTQQSDQAQSSTEREPIKSKANKTSTQPSVSSNPERKVTTEQPAFVKYLVQFHTDKSAWKFNKKKQNDLFKNLYNLDLLPSEHNEAIISYVLGLEGANATARIRESSRAVLDELVKKIDTEDGLADGADMEYAEARLDAYNRALQRSLEKLAHADEHRNEYDDQQYEEMQLQAERGTRAERVLSSLRVEDVRNCSNTSELEALVEKNEASHRHSSGADTDGKPTTKRKKRKLRTQDTIDTDSSESETEEPAPKKPHVTTTPTTTHQPFTAFNSRPNPYFDGRIDINRKNPAKKIFDDDLLDQAFPKPKTYHETAPKRQPGASSSKARGFAHTHGTAADESDSEDD